MQGGLHICHIKTIINPYPMIIFDSDAEVQKQFTLNQSRVEEITMKEDLGSITLAQDDGFGKYTSPNSIMPANNKHLLS